MVLQSFNILTGSCGKNTNWYMSYCTSQSGKKYIMIENIKTGFVDFPTIAQISQKLVYNSPFIVPNFVKKFLNNNYTLNF